MAFLQRQRRLRALLEGAKLTAALLSDPNDVFYYTGFLPTAPALLLLSRHAATLFAGSVDTAAARLRTCEARFVRSFAEVKLPAGRLGYDQGSLTAQQYFQLRRRGRHLVPAAKLLAQPRQVKEPGELALMRGAIRIALRSHKATRLGGSERAVAAAFDAKLRAAGAEPSFATIVAAGKNSSDIHHRPTSRNISFPLVFDFGSRWQNYCSDTARTVIEPRDANQRGLRETVQEMQGQLIDFLQPGMRWKAVQDEWQRLMQRKRFRVHHGFGHGIGLAVHEPLPLLLPGSVVTVEPGIYLRWGGCRIEDMVLMRKSGPKVLTTHRSLF